MEDLTDYPSPGAFTRQEATRERVMRRNDRVFKLLVSAAVLICLLILLAMILRWEV